MVQHTNKAPTLGAAIRPERSPAQNREVPPGFYHTTDLAWRLLLTECRWRQRMRGWWDAATDALREDWRILVFPVAVLVAGFWMAGRVTR